MKPINDPGARARPSSVHLLLRSALAWMVNRDAGHHQGDAKYITNARQLSQHQGADDGSGGR